MLRAPASADSRICGRCARAGTGVNSLVLHFGSRSGSWFALGLFVAMFGTLGWSVAREIRLRSKTSSRIAGALGLALLVGPVAMVYASSLSGVYEAEVGGGTLRLHY